MPRFRWAARGNPFVRQWKLIVLLRRAPRTLAELAQLLGCHQRTIRRDLYALQAVPLPITSRYAANEGTRPHPLRGRRWSHGDHLEPNVWSSVQARASTFARYSRHGSRTCCSGQRTQPSFKATPEVNRGAWVGRLAIAARVPVHAELDVGGQRPLAVRDAEALQFTRELARGDRDRHPDARVSEPRPRAAIARRAAPADRPGEGKFRWFAHSDQHRPRIAPHRVQVHVKRSNVSPGHAVTVFVQAWSTAQSVGGAGRSSKSVSGFRPTGDPPPAPPRGAATLASHRWTMRHVGKPKVFACDKWNRVADNVAAIARHIEALRAVDRYGVGEMEQVLAGYTALQPSAEDWRSVFAFGPDETPKFSEVVRRFKAAMSRAHPDTNDGDTFQAARLNTARDLARWELSQIDA